MSPKPGSDDAAATMTQRIAADPTDGISPRLSSTTLIRSAILPGVWPRQATNPIWYTPNITVYSSCHPGGRSPVLIFSSVTSNSGSVSADAAARTTRSRMKPSNLRPGDAYTMTDQSRSRMAPYTKPSGPIRHTRVSRSARPAKSSSGRGSLSRLRCR